ncbi:hypothetical protein C8R45DRAFT_500054 [Mycena sanguinolenta]|nr:hypothetical protein C8R45DRAFT_500054 [Mycena sanguinolenta]
MGNFTSLIPSESTTVLSSTTESAQISSSSSSLTTTLVQPASPPPSTPTASAGQTSKSISSSSIPESHSQATSSSLSSAPAASPSFSSAPPTSLVPSLSSTPETLAPNPNSIAQTSIAQTSIAQTSVSSLASTPSPQISGQSSFQKPTRKTRPLLVGGIIGIVLAAAALVAVLFWLWRRRRNRNLPGRARLDGDVLPTGPSILDMTQNYDAGSATSLLRRRYLIDELHAAQEESDAVAEMERRLAVNATSESPSLAPWSTSGSGPHRPDLMSLRRLRNETSLHTPTTGGDWVPTDASMLETTESSDGDSTFGGSAIGAARRRYPVDGLHGAQKKSAMAEIEGPSQNYDAGSATSLLRSRYLIDELHAAQEESDAVAEMERRLAVNATSESQSLAPWSTSGSGPHRPDLMSLRRLRNGTSLHTSTTGGDRVPMDSSVLETAESSDGGSSFGGSAIGAVPRRYPIDGLHGAQEKSATAEIEGPVTANASPESLIPASRSISGSQRSKSDLMLLRQRNEILTARIRQLEEQIRAPGTLGPPPDYVA